LGSTFSRRKSLGQGLSIAELGWRDRGGALAVPLQVEYLPFGTGEISPPGPSGLQGKGKGELPFTPPEFDRDLADHIELLFAGRDCPAK
jgi:hypothetical protein